MRYLSSSTVRAAGWAMTAAIVLAACGGDKSITAPPTSTPTKTPKPTATPIVCDLPPGPIVRYAVAPRLDQIVPGPIDVPMRVRIGTPYADEVLCLDKEFNHRVEFDSKQKNAAGQEACWENEPVWQVVDDPDGVTSNAGQWGPANFMFRVRVEPRGLETYFTVQATLDGVRSHQWQAGASYPQTPLKIVTLSADQIAKQCKCTYHGNAVYSGNGCPK
jgi:hypothetical protein